MNKKQENRFEIIFEEKNNMTSSNRILRDNETGISYLFHTWSYSGGLTPLLDCDGKPLTDKKQRQDYALTDSPDISNDDALKRLTNKIAIHLSEIKFLNESIEDMSVSAELSEIEKTMRTFQAQLKKEPKVIRRISETTQFFEYYMPAIVKILNSYKHIENNELTGENAAETKKQVRDILPLIKRAFEKELDYMFADEMLDITTDVKVLESMLSKDGLIDKII
jgi:5-bromo-4-chloroindolyl phosphate hydrolysis protein